VEAGNSGISLWVPPVAGAVAAALVMVVVAMTADRREMSMMTWLQAGVKAGRAWSPTDSWVTNIAGTGAALGAVVSSLSTFAATIGSASVLGVTILFVMFGGAAAFAPLLYAVTAVSSPGDPTSPDQITGRMWGFLLAGATSLLAVMGEIATVALLFWQVSPSAADRVVVLVVLCVGGLAVAAYSARTLIALSAPAATPPAATPKDAAFGARNGVSMIGPSSLSATLLQVLRCGATGRPHGRRRTSARDTGQVRLPVIAFRACTRDDLATLAGWLAQPHVAQWWREDPDLAAVRDRYLPCLDGRDPAELFILQADGEPAGFFQRYLIADDPDWAAALRGTGQPGVDTGVGIDYLIGEVKLTGRGLGTAAIAAFTRLAFERYRGVEVVAAAISQGNTASWRAAEKAGYRRCWAGELASDDPSDEGPMYIYRQDRS
jgi:aminoglycoside 6'-N-acetyltransferase